MSYREIRVRPVVRYIVTEFVGHSDGESGSGGSIVEFGEFDNADRANIVAHLLANDSPTRQGDPPATVVSCEKLKIYRTDWTAPSEWKIEATH